MGLHSRPDVLPFGPEALTFWLTFVCSGSCRDSRVVCRWWVHRGLCRHFCPVRVSVASVCSHLLVTKGIFHFHSLNCWQACELPDLVLVGSTPRLYVVIPKGFTDVCRRD